MKVLLINQNPVIKKLVGMASKKLNLEVENIARIPPDFQTDGYICIIVDDENVGKNLARLTELQDHIKVCLLFGRKTQIKNHEFNIAIQKPFLPTDILEILNECMPSEDSQETKQEKPKDSASVDSANKINEIDMDLQSAEIEPPTDLTIPKGTAKDDIQAEAESAKDFDELNFDPDSLDFSALEEAGEVSHHEEKPKDTQKDSKQETAEKEDSKKQKDSDKEEELQPAKSSPFDSDLSDLKSSTDNPLDLANFDLDSMVSSSALKEASMNIEETEKEAKEVASHDDEENELFLDDDERELLQPSPKKFLESLEKDKQTSDTKPEQNSKDLAPKTKEKENTNESDLESTKTETTQDFDTLDLESMQIPLDNAKEDKDISDSIDTNKGDAIDLQQDMDLDLASLGLEDATPKAESKGMADLKTTKDSKNANDMPDDLASLDSLDTTTQDSSQQDKESNAKDLGDSHDNLDDSLLDTTESTKDSLKDDSDSLDLGKQQTTQAASKNHLDDAFDALTSALNGAFDYIDNDKAPLQDTTTKEDSKDTLDSLNAGDETLDSLDSNKSLDSEPLDSLDLADSDITKSIENPKDSAESLSDDDLDLASLGLDDVDSTKADSKDTLDSLNAKDDSTESTKADSTESLSDDDLDLASLGLDDTDSAQKTEPLDSKKSDNIDDLLNLDDALELDTTNEATTDSKSLENEPLDSKDLDLLAGDEAKTQNDDKPSKTSAANIPAENSKSLDDVFDELALSLDNAFDYIDDDKAPLQDTTTKADSKDTLDSLNAKDDSTESTKADSTKSLSDDDLDLASLGLDDTDSTKADSKDALDSLNAKDETLDSLDSNKSLDSEPLDSLDLADSDITKSIENPKDSTESLSDDDLDLASLGLDDVDSTKADSKDTLDSLNAKDDSTESTKADSAESLSDDDLDLASLGLDDTDSAQKTEPLDSKKSDNIDDLLNLDDALELDTTNEATTDSKSLENEPLDSKDLDLLAGDEAKTQNDEIELDTSSIDSFDDMLHIEPDIMEDVVENALEEEENERLEAQNKSDKESAQKDILDKDNMQEVNNLLKEVNDTPQENLDKNLQENLDESLDSLLNSDNQTKQEELANSLDNDGLSDLEKHEPSLQTQANPDVEYVSLPSHEEEIDNLTESEMAEALGEGGDSIVRVDNTEGMAKSKPQPAETKVTDSNIENEISDLQELDTMNEEAEAINALQETDLSADNASDNETKDSIKQEIPKESPHDTITLQNIDKEMNADSLIDFFKNTPKEKLHEIFDGADINFSIHFNKENK